MRLEPPCQLKNFTSDNLYIKNPLNVRGFFIFKINLIGDALIHQLAQGQVMIKIVITFLCHEDGDEFFFGVDEKVGIISAWPVK